MIIQRLRTRDTCTGTGFGLAIVGWIIDRHGGAIRIETIPGEGTISNFSLLTARDGKVCRRAPRHDGNRTVVHEYPPSARNPSRVMVDDYLFSRYTEKKKPVLQGVTGSSCLRKYTEAISSRALPTRSSIIRGARSRRPNSTMIAIAAPSPSPTPQAIGVMKT